MYNDPDGSWQRPLPGTGQTGILRGMDAAFLDVLTAYSPGPGTPGVIDPTLHCVLSLVDWPWYAWHRTVTMSVPAGSAVIVNPWNVPADTRAELHSVAVERITGDNQVIAIIAAQPSGYYSGTTNEVRLKDIAFADTFLFWPDPAGAQTINRGYVNPPVLIEPGGSVKLEPSGEGAAISTFEVRMSFKLSKLIRARVPTVGS